MNNLNKTFSLSVFEKIGGIVIGLFFVSFSVVLVLLLIQNFSNSNYPTTIIVVITVFSFAFGVLLLIRLNKYKLEILDENIRITNLFFVKEILWKDIVGYKLATNHIKLYFKNSAKVYWLELKYKNNIEIQNLFREKFPSEFTTESEIKKLKYQVDFFNDSRYGNNKEQRLQKLVKFKWWAATIGRFCFYGVIVCALAPTSSVIANSVILVLLAAAYLYAYFIGDIISAFNTEKQSDLAIDLSLQYSLCFVMFRAFYCWKIIPSNAFWFSWIVSTIGVFILAIIFDKLLIKKVLECVVIFFMCSLPAFGLLIHINSLFEIGKTEEYEVAVVAKGEMNSRNSFNQVDILIESWQYNTKVSTLFIDAEVNKSLNGKSKIKITVHKGLFGIRWVTYYGQFQCWDMIKRLFNADQTEL